MILTDFGELVMKDRMSVLLRVISGPAAVAVCMMANAYTNALTQPDNQQ